MESLGEKLQTARKARNLTYEDVGRDTNISSRYIEALEKEDFSSFPAEPYIIGFLKNYSAYLGLNVEELLSLYRAFKIQEQPVPVEQLLKSPSRLPKILAITAAVLILLGGSGGGVYYLLTRPPKPKAPAPVGRSPVEYVMNGDSLERRFYQGDSILIPVETTQYKIELVNLGDTVTVRSPSGTVVLDLSQEVTVDLNNDGIPDLRVAAADFVKGNADMGAMLRLRLDDSSLAPAGDYAAAASETGSAPAGSAVTVIFSSPNAYPFTLQSSFQSYCMFRWEILREWNRQERNERYFQRSDELNIQAQNGIRIWTSNARAARLQVIGGGRTVPLELGGPGEVVVADIVWVSDGENRYRLILNRLEAGNS